MLSIFFFPLDYPSSGITPGATQASVTIAIARDHNINSFQPAFRNNTQ